MRIRRTASLLGMFMLPFVAESLGMIVCRFPRFNGQVPGIVLVFVIPEALGIAALWFYPSCRWQIKLAWSVAYGCLLYLCVVIYALGFSCHFYGDCL